MRAVRRWRFSLRIPASVHLFLPRKSYCLSRSIKASLSQARDLRFPPRKRAHQALLRRIPLMYARFVCFLVLCGSLLGQATSPSLTIYNQDFAVVRQELPLDLKSGENQVNVNNITMHLEPDSVILRDPTGKHAV